MTTPRGTIIYGWESDREDAEEIYNANGPSVRYIGVVIDSFVAMGAIRSEYIPRTCEIKASMLEELGWYDIPAISEMESEPEVLVLFTES